MNRRHFCVCLATAALALAQPDTARAEGRQVLPAARVYELRLYTATTGRLADLQGLFRAQGARLLTKHGIENVFDATVLEGARVDGPDAANMLVCVVAHSTRAAADRSWAAFDADSEWKAAWTRAEQGGPLLSKPVASTFMNAADFSPALEAPTAAGATPRTFELRIYNTGAEGTPDTVARFRQGIAGILAKVGMTQIAYWTAADNSAFIYLLAHKDREAARASWAAFTPDYRAFMTDYNARAAAAGTPAPPAGTRRPDDNRFLVPTDFSPRR